MLLQMMITVNILAGQTSPEMTVYQGMISDNQTCQEVIAAVESMPPKLIDLVSGKPVLMTLYQCVPIDSDIMNRDMEYAVETYGTK